MVPLPYLFCFLWKVIATALLNLGNAESYTGNVENAKRHLIRALRIYKEIHGENHPIIAANLNYLGYAYLQKGQVWKANETVETALKIMDNYSPSRQGNLPLENNVIRRSVMSVQIKLIPRQHANLWHFLRLLFTLYLIAFAPAWEPYWIGLLFTVISARCNGAKAAPRRSLKWRVRRIH